MVELKPAADVLSSLTGLREMPPRERDVAARRADNQVPRVGVRHLNPSHDRNAVMSSRVSALG